MPKWDAFDRIDREHPELTGNDRLRAVRALQKQNKAARRQAKEAGVECPACRETVKPVEKAGLAALSVWLFLLAMAAVVCSLVAAVHTFTDDTVHGWPVIVMWPVAIAQDGWVHPKLFAVLIAFAALVAAGWASGKLGERAERNARCPNCGRTLRATPPVDA